MCTKIKQLQKRHTNDNSLVYVQYSNKQKNEEYYYTISTFILGILKRNKVNDLSCGDIENAGDDDDNDSMMMVLIWAAIYIMSPTTN